MYFVGLTKQLRNEVSRLVTEEGKVRLLEVVTTVENVGHNLISARIKERRDSTRHQQVGDHSQAPHICRNILRLLNFTSRWWM